MKTITALVLGLACLTTALRAEKPISFAATGKILCGMSAGKPSELCVMAPEFYATQIEILQGGELGRRTLERMRALNPELKESDVQLKVTRVKGTSIIDVVAVGPEPKYTRIYLGSLLDEYWAFLKDIDERSSGDSLDRIIKSVLSRETDVKAKGAALIKARVNKANTPEDVLVTLEFEFNQAKEDYQDWKRALDRLAARGLTNRPFVILERPVAAVPLGR